MSEVFSTKWNHDRIKPQIPLTLIIVRAVGSNPAAQMLSDQPQRQAVPFKCGFCGFVYEEIEEAEECELHCVTRALERMDERERAGNFPCRVV